MRYWPASPSGARATQMIRVQSVVLTFDFLARCADCEDRQFNHRSHGSHGPEQYNHAATHFVLIRVIHGQKLFAIRSVVGIVVAAGPRWASCRRGRGQRPGRRSRHKECPTVQSPGSLRSHRIPLRISARARRRGGRRRSGRGGSSGAARSVGAVAPS
jgi:hypothetical protein